MNNQIQIFNNQKLERNGFNSIQKKYKLFRPEPNCVWKTYEPIFCDETKKQIWKGYLAATEDEVIGIYCFESFYRVCQELLIEREFVYTRSIESMAAPIKRTRKIERSKMTISLRYHILQRDKFRCRACGAKAGDVELHIDHIVPVSRGGLTIESNLQALCSSCNIGKSDT